uniref:Uncharacterized protein n=1 Tax=Magallana gigas TaxID=29159 RepID=A0A8W8MIZ4_MAGGI
MPRSTITQYRINHGKRKGNSTPISVLELYLLTVVMMMMMMKEMLVTVTSGCVHYREKKLCQKGHFKCLTCRFRLMECSAVKHTGNLEYRRLEPSTRPCYSSA